MIDDDTIQRARDLRARGLSPHPSSAVDVRFWAHRRMKSLLRAILLVCDYENA
jgi:hypothetical protein